MITLQQAQEIERYIDASPTQGDDYTPVVKGYVAELVMALTPKPKVQNPPPVVTGMFRANRTRTIFRGIEGMEQTIDLHFQQKFGGRELSVRFISSPPHDSVICEPAKATGQGRLAFDLSVREYVTALTDQDIAEARLKVSTRNVSTD